MSVNVCVFDRDLFAPLKQKGRCAIARAGLRPYLINDTSFVEIPVGLDAVGNVEIAGVAACFRGGALRRVQAEEVVSLRAGFADTV